MFETKKELADLQRLLDESYAKAKGIAYSGFNSGHRLSAGGLAGFQGVKLVACATVNSKGEPRAAPRSAAFLHGRFYLAANSKSTMVRRLRLNPSIGFTYFENHLLIIGHGTTVPLMRGTSEYKRRGAEWTEAFKGGKDALSGTDMLIELQAAHLVAFAVHPEKYPAAWRPKRAPSG